jgi:hypothetical protein
MSDTHIWNVEVLAPTSGSVSFVEATAVIGDLIHADFSWDNAVYHPTGAVYATMYLYDPNNNVVDSYIEEAVYTGTHQLSALANIQGDWKAEIKIWDGDEWLTLTDILHVSGPDIRIEPASEFFNGPFIAETMQTVCNVVVKNYGDLGDQVHINLYEYPNTASENLVGSWYTGANVEPGITIERGFDLLIPGTHAYTWPLGVKVYGNLEAVPSWGGLGTAIFGIRKEEKVGLPSAEIPSWVIPAAGVAGLLGFIYLATRSR